MAIHPHNTQTETKWSKGLFQVMIRSPNWERPYGYCDGSSEDENSLLEMAQGEGLFDAQLQKRTLKTGRQIWTLTSSEE